MDGYKHAQADTNGKLILNGYDSNKTQTTLCI